MLSATARSVIMVRRAMATTYRTHGLVLTEHDFEVPVEHDRPDGSRITVFAREVADPDGLDKPYLVYLQGGPGFEAPRPARHPSGPAWLDRALQDFRVLMLDQRGTGRSSPLDATATADQLVHYRADAVVRDAELVRQALDVDRWSVLGQSFGGFCATRYLSSAPEGLREAFLTGGLPAFQVPVDEVYATTFELAIERSRRYYERYPEDRERVRALMADPVRLASGDLLTADRVRQLGLNLGMSDGAETLHYLLELPPDSPAFRHDADDPLDFARDPIYHLLQEASWADGSATRWAAQRVRPEDYEREPGLLYGEHMLPSVYDDYAALRPLRDAAHALAEHEWPRLYDFDVLASNEVPAAAVIYADDLYVPMRYSVESARRIRGLRPWITNEYEHNGLRADGERILGRLIDLARGRA
ncbi:MAG: alpha/beta fold hydrolase [Solirubrobacteraceae bacterium]